MRWCGNALSILAGGFGKRAGRMALGTINGSTLLEIERAIGGLTQQELDELYAWLDRNWPQPIDAQLEADLAAGRLDGRIDRVVADHKARHTRGL